LKDAERPTGEMKRTFERQFALNRTKTSRKIKKKTKIIENQFKKSGEVKVNIRGVYKTVFGGVGPLHSISFLKKEKIGNDAIGNIQKESPPFSCSAVKKKIRIFEIRSF